MNRNSRATGSHLNHKVLTAWDLEEPAFMLVTAVTRLFVEVGQVDICGNSTFFVV